MFVLNNLPLWDNTALQQPVSMQGFPTNGKSTRVASDGTLLVIGGQKTKENKGFVTVRRTIRLEKPELGLGADGNATARPFVQVTFGHPEDPAITNLELSKLAAQLFNFLMTGEDPGSSGVLATATNNSAAIELVYSRLALGEV